MSFQPGSNNYAVAVGTNPQHLIHLDVRPPTTTDILYQVGTEWIDTVGNAVYFLTSFSASANVTSANWVSSGGATTEISTLTGNTGTATPVGGNILVAGTASQITTAASGSTVTLSLPAAITAPGSLTTTTTLTGGTGVTATTGNVTVANGNLAFGTSGNKLISTSVGSTTAAGANSFGTVALVSGTATVATTSVTASSMIFLTCQALGTVVAPSALCVSAKTASTSFVINASQATDTSTVAWFIVN
jgi:hypothetical protein